MTIQRSAGAEIRQLIEALGGADDTRRESAIARLALIGPRAMEHLLQETPAAADPARAGLLRAMERLADPRALAPARAALADAPPAIQICAVGVLRALLASDKPTVSRDAFDTLVSVALDRQRVAAVRLAAWDAIRETTEDAREPVRHALAGDPDPDVRARAADTPAPHGDVWQDATEGRLPATPDALKAALAAHKSTARLTELQKLVDRLRAREQREPDAGVREQWRAIRGSVHQALAARNSRLALYDLRDSLLAADRVPVAFLAAIEEIGDVTCLDTIAAAYEASSPSGDTWLRQHLASAFRAIVQREGLTRRHAAIKRLLARWPEATGDLLGR
jgi:hypothetical protein